MIDGAQQWKWFPPDVGGAPLQKKRNGDDIMCGSSGGARKNDVVGAPASKKGTATTP